MKKNHFSRKFRQLSSAKRELENLLSQGKPIGSVSVKKLILKIRSIALQLAEVFSVRYVKRTLGSVSLLIGGVFSNQATAQHFLDPVSTPFGLASLSYFAFPAIADLDDDGDFDILVYEEYGVAKYFENTGNSVSPAFANAIASPFGISSVEEFGVPTFADIDDDGDMDLFVGQYYGNLGFFENVGTPSAPSFADRVDNPFGFSPAPDTYLTSPTFADLDDDGDLDLLVGYTAYYSNEMVYFQNVGSADNPVFGKPNSSPFGITSGVFLPVPVLADIDMDGDYDLMSGNYEGTFLYQENIGTSSSPEMSPVAVNPFNLVNTYALSAPAIADMDGDGDLDMLVGEYYGALQYFENAPEVNINELNEIAQLKVYPNPTTDFLVIDHNLPVKELIITDVQGKMISTLAYSKNRINVSALKPGEYILKVNFKNGASQVTKFVKR